MTSQRTLVRSVGRIKLVLLAVLWLGAWQALGAANAPSFTAEQATKGKPLYQKHCATCHGAQLQGEQVSPALNGDRFDQAWRGKSAAILGFHLRRMPPEPADNPGGLGDEVYTNILAFILQSNGFAASDTPLPSDLASLDAVAIPEVEGAVFDPDAPVAADARSPALAKVAPVTDEMLRNPSPDDWLHPSRTYDNQGYSPLDAINKENVQFLTIAWRAPLRNGNSMPMPIVHQGIMYLQTTPDTVLALDATNGQVQWRYQHKPKNASSQKMGVALHGDMVFVPTSDLQVIALNAKTGELIWKTEVAGTVTGQSRMPMAYQLRSPPLVVGDKVLQGVTASFVPKGGYVIALDVATGKEAWRFNTIARPGEPNGDTWNDVPLEKRSGGSIWHELSYDPELDLVYFGIAPTYDTGPLLKPVANASSPKVNSNALYTNCTVAIRPKTGELVWYYQHVENDQWDLDWVFERTLATVQIDGKPRKVVMNVGKMGILEALDAATGKYLFSVDPGVQNVITAIDPKTGAKTIDPARLPDPSRSTDVCPSAIGARSWPTTSFSPQTQFAYLPLTESCMKMGPEGFRLLTSGVGISGATHPGTADGKLGRLQAIDVANKKLGWNVDLTNSPTTGILTTGSGLLFVGDLDPSLKAFDATNGKQLWSSKLDAPPSSSVITYKVDGKQYVAVIAGMNNFHIDGLAR